MTADADLIQQCRDYVDSAGTTAQPRMFELARLVVRLADDLTAHNPGWAAEAAAWEARERWWDWVHTKALAWKNDEWLTPPEILAALGAFDLDPCAPVTRPWDTAAAHYTAADDGLALPWHGRVWCNPPFGREAVKWMRRMKDHGNGIALLPARTETAMFYETVWGQTDGVLFIRGRPHFHYVDGRRASFNSGAPIALIAYGQDNLRALQQSGLGVVVVEYKPM